MRRFASLIRVLPSVVATLLVASDVKRWRKIVDEVPPWDDRNRIIAGFIPERSAVLDLGSGACLLANYLKDGCTYQPCDLVSETPDVVHCDFNAGIYPHLTRRYDYVVCSGILEYMQDPRDFVGRIKGYGSQIILSYNVCRPDEALLLRLAKGWKNHLSEGQIARLFSSLSLRAELLCNRYEGEKIFRLSSAV